MTTTSTDTRLAESIRDALENDPDVPKTNISVSVVDRAVILRGRLTKKAESVRAYEIVKRASAPCEVHNYMTVDSEGAKMDKKHALLLRTMIKRDDRLNDENIRVAVHNGLALLSGQVESSRRKQLAEDTVTQSGIVAVRNEIHVTEA